MRKQWGNFVREGTGRKRMFRTLLYSSNNMLGKSCKGDVRHSECHYKEDSRDRFRDIDTTPPFPAGSVILNSRDAALKCSAASEIRLAHEAQTCLPRKRGLTLRDLSKERKCKKQQQSRSVPGARERRSSRTYTAVANTRVARRNPARALPSGVAWPLRCVSPGGF